MENMENKDIIENAEVEAVEAPVEEAAEVAAEPAVVDNGKGLSVAALILGILGIIGGWIPVVGYFTTVCAVLGIILGVKGRAKSIAAQGKASGLATAGLVLGIIGTAFAVLGLLCTVVCGAALLAAA